MSPEPELHLDSRTKGIPVWAGRFPAAAIADKMFLPRSGDLQYPLLTVDTDALAGNIAAMLAFCRAHDAWLAPHGKTPMAPKLALRLIESGCWGLSVANLQQASVMLEAGVANVIVANEVGGPGAARQLVEMGRGYTAARIFVFADSVAAVAAFGGVLRPDDRVSFLVETGITGGRNGARDMATVRAVVAEIVAQEGPARLGGVASYEGAALTDDPDASVHRVNALLDFTVEAMRHVRTARPAGEMLVSVGGSAVFDLVVGRLGPALRSMENVRLVMRSGAFLFHDHGIYARFLAEMDARGGFKGAGGVQTASAAFAPALRLWAEVLSRPEPTLAIAGFGMRDVSFDQGLPVLLDHYRGGRPLSTAGAANPAVTVKKLNDQHAFLSVPAEADMAVGDILAFGISHPCTCLDRWRVLFGIDATGRITDAYPTCF